MATKAKIEEIQQATLTLPDPKEVEALTAVPSEEEIRDLVPTLKCGAILGIEFRSPADLLQFKVTDETTYEIAGYLRTNICGPRKKTAVSYFKGVVDLANKLHKTLTKMRSGACTPWEQADDHLEQERLAWNRKRRDEAERQQRAREEAERLRLQAEQAQQQQAQKSIAELKAEYRALIGSGKMVEARALAAQIAELSGQVAAPPPVQQAPVHVPVVERAQPKMDGLASRGKWKARITDKKLALQTVLDGKLPVEVVEFDLKIPCAVAAARQVEGDIGLPGFEAYFDEIEYTTGR